ncbi:MAG: 1-acyl-sn-glycerol-3-phosphate acyltransferase [Actinomycetota bacterium]|nr:1-acyl-sn-glycerol-3-phosphate acyltransferase [Actinomycetota bacterium]
MEPIYVATKWVVVPPLRAWFRWHIEGLDQIPIQGPAIIAANHISYLDPLAIGNAVVKAGRRPRFLAKSELMNDRKVGWVLRGCGQIEVQRGTSNALLALEHAYEALAAGEIVCIFPEGTVTTDRHLRPMPSKTGASRLALRASAPVIPCGVWGPRTCGRRTTVRTGGLGRSWRCASANRSPTGAIPRTEWIGRGPAPISPSGSQGSWRASSH